MSGWGSGNSPPTNLLIQVYTPQSFNIEPENDGFQKGISFSLGVIFGV